MNRKIFFLFFGIIFLIGIVNAGIWNDRLFFYYNLDEQDVTGSGAIYDSLGNYNATNDGADNCSGKINTGYTFIDGNTDTIESDANIALSGNNPVSINIWIKPDANEDLQNIITLGTPIANMFGIAKRYGSADQFYLWGAVATGFGTASDYDDIWVMLTVVYNGTAGLAYINGVNIANSTGGNLNLAEDKLVIGMDPREQRYYDGDMDEIGIWNRTLTQAEITQLYNSGDGLPYGSEGGFPEISVSLLTPENDTLSNNDSLSFLATLTPNTYNLTNGTLFVWYNNGTLFNYTINDSVTLTEIQNISFNVFDLSINDYYWNVYGCMGNGNGTNCSFAENNFTFTIGSLINSISYSNSTFETSNEKFIINISLFEGAEVSLAQLIYNGTNYTISNVTAIGNYYIFEKRINIPLNINGSANQTNEFYIKFTYGGNSIQTFGPYEQNSSFIKLIQCNPTYSLQSLNFTFVDEDTQLNINGANNATTIETSFKYWLGEGDIYKTYSFQNITSSINNYQFCIYPYYPDNFTFKTDMDMEFSADGYRENSYFLRNSTLNNISNDISLYLLSEEIATKFFLTFKKGTNMISGATVTVQKYFTGFGEYKTTTILLTDDDGEATMWQEVDSKFKYSIIKNGELLGIVERVSTCSSAPCTLTIMITEDISSAFEAYYDYYAINVLSNLSYNRSSKIVTYEFIDITGLANYFRLEVRNSRLNDTGTVICNSIAYTSAGTVICNLTGYDGDFTAIGYLSRSPEKIDKVYSFLVVDTLIDSLGLTGILIVMILLITLVIAGVVISKGNPSTVLFILGISILGLKLINLFPFSWVVVATLELLILFIIFKIRT